MLRDPILVAPTRPAQIVMSDSLEMRLMVAGRLSPTALDVHHDRAELAAVLGQAMRPDVEGGRAEAGRNAR
jgi:hypothetical protein